MNVTKQEIMAELKAIYSSPWAWVFIALGIAAAFYTRSIAVGLVVTALLSGVWIMNRGPIHAG